MTGALPPSSRCTRLRSAAAAAATSMPARTLPVIDTIAGNGCSTSARPVSRSPHTTLNTPGGQELGRELGEHHACVSGVVSAGFSTTVLPAASAGAIFQIAIIIG